MKKLFAICLIFVLIVTSISAAAFEATQMSSNDNGFHLSLAPAVENNAATIQSNSTHLNIDISASSYDYIHDSTIDIVAAIEWSNGAVEWDTELYGSALVYNPDNNHPILIGAVTGYNGEKTVDNFIGADLKYDVLTNQCDVIIHYDIGNSTGQSSIEFGSNGPNFADAILSYASKIQ